MWSLTGHLGEAASAATPGLKARTQATGVSSDLRMSPGLPFLTFEMAPPNSNKNK